MVLEIFEEIKYENIANIGAPMNPPMIRLRICIDESFSNNNMYRETKIVMDIDIRKQNFVKEPGKLSEFT